MPLTVNRDPKRRLIRLEGEFALSSAAELKHQLLEGLASGEELQIDLDGAGEIDIALLQLLYAAAQDAAQQGGGIVSGVSEAASRAARDAGFVRFPGSAIEE